MAMVEWYRGDLMLTSFISVSFLSEVLKWASHMSSADHLMPALVLNSCFMSSEEGVPPCRFYCVATASFPAQCAWWHPAWEVTIFFLWREVPSNPPSLHEGLHEGHCQMSSNRGILFNPRIQIWIVSHGFGVVADFSCYKCSCFERFPAHGGEQGTTDLW